MPKQPFMNRRYTRASLRGHTTTHTVLLRMAKDADRAARIADLKEKHPRLTWAKIAHEIGVTERAATAWQRTGALKPENAERLAELFDVDFDYVWSGPRPDTPNLFAERRTNHKPVAVDRLDGELADRITIIEDTLAGITRLLREARSEQDRISALLERQTRVLERIEQATAHANDAADRLDDAVERAATGLRSAPPAKRPAAPRTARKHSPRASKPGPA
jgi:uncharacterized protein YukE